MQQSRLAPRGMGNASYSRRLTVRSLSMSCALRSDTLSSASSRSARKSSTSAVKRWLCSVANCSFALRSLTVAFHKLNGEDEEAGDGGSSGAETSAGGDDEPTSMGRGGRMALEAMMKQIGHKRAMHEDRTQRPELQQTSYTKECDTQLSWPCKAVQCKQVNGTINARRWARMPGPQRSLLSRSAQQPARPLPPRRPAMNVASALDAAEQRVGRQGHDRNQWPWRLRLITSERSSPPDSLALRA